jgi:DNA-binding PadR family transcriptional regulator
MADIRVKLGYVRRGGLAGGEAVVYLRRGMARGRNGLPAAEAVLGLVIERADHGFGLERRLEERFGSARFAYSTAYNALYRMEREGLVRVAGARSGNAHETTYEATEKGREHFREWVRAPTTMPLLREELHAKIALCEPRELPRLMEVLHQEELACMSELDQIRERLAGEQSEARGTQLAERDWSKLMALGVAHGEAAYWGGRIEQLAQLRAYLGELREEAARRTLNEDRRRHEAKRRSG